MLFRYFLFAMALCVLSGTVLYIFNDPYSRKENENSYNFIELANLLIAFGVSLLIPTLILFYIEIIKKKRAPNFLTYTSFSLHIFGLISLLRSYLVSVLGQGYELEITGFLYLGIISCVLGMSLLPAILLISLRRK
jgi:hypothetical protein